MDSRDIEIVKVIISHNRRPLAKSVVARLAESILDIGLQNPIGVTPDYKLIHGRHRLEAFKSLGRNTIPAVVHDMDDLHAQMAEIDENLIRKQLSKAEECKALARRKELYLALHPETKRGTAGARVSNKTRHGRDATKENISFAEDTASKTGRTARAVNMDVALGSALPDAIVEKIAETPIANNKSELKKLAKLDEEEQLTVANMLVDGEVQSVSEAVRCDDKPEPAKAAKKEADTGKVLRKMVMATIKQWKREQKPKCDANTLAASILETIVDELLGV